MLANGIAIYGGHDNTVTDNSIADIVASGGGLHVGNRFKAVALSGTTTLARNELNRCGCLDMNWKFGVGAIWFYALDSAMDGNIIVADTVIRDSPYNAFGVIGKKVSDLAISNVSVDGVGTFVVDLQCGGGGRFSDVRASGIGFHAIYSCGTPFDLEDGGGNTGWLDACESAKDCALHNDTLGQCTKQRPYCTHCGWPPEPHNM